MNITKNTEDVRQFFAKMRKENLARIALHVAPVLPTDIRSTVSRYIAGETDTIDDETTRIALSFLTWRSVVCEAELIKHAEQNSKRELTFHEDIHGKGNLYWSGGYDDHTGVLFSDLD